MFLFIFSSHARCGIKREMGGRELKTPISHLRAEVCFVRGKTGENRGGDNSDEGEDEHAPIYRATFIGL